MKPLSEFNGHGVKYLFTDIDDTLTSAGRLDAAAYTAIWKLHQAGVKVVPITGRPAGWCELIARQWPVDGVIGENGALYYRYSEGSMKREYVYGESEIVKNRKKLNVIEEDVLKQVPGSATASDQFCRLFDLAIDFCEDVPRLNDEDIKKIVEIFASHGATAKVSSIHVNGWFGDYDKLSMCKTYAKNEWGITEEALNTHSVFVGDSPNDEPMFAYFKNSVAVANFAEFQDQVSSLPTYIAQCPQGQGFVDVAEKIIGN